MTENMLTRFELKDVTVQDDIYTFPKSAGTMEFRYEAGKPFGREVKDTDYIVLDIKCLEESSVGIDWTLICPDGRRAQIKMGLLPQIKTRIALPFSTAGGKNLFLPRTPGKLKSVFQGQPIDYNESVCFTLTKEPTQKDTRFEITYFGLSDTEPEYPVETKALVDEMGQKAVADWKGKTKSVEEMAQRMKSELANPPSPALGDDMSEYGGCRKRKICDGTGYFSLHKINDRYLLADPDGYEFFSTGLDCVNIDGDANLRGIKCLAGKLPEKSPAWIRDQFFSWHKNNLYLVFGDEYYEKWCELTQARMKKWGFNTVACWSDLRFAEKYCMPHTYIMHGYPGTEKYIFRDFPDVFSPEFAVSADKWAQQMTEMQKDRYLIGYFLGNEPEWAFVNGVNLAEMVLSDEAGTATKEKLIEYMKAQYTDISLLNSEWGTDYASFDDMHRPVKSFGEKASEALMKFACEMIREYIRVPSLAIKKYDPNHLNLGIRYAWLSSEALASGSEFTDVFSFNCYSTSPYDSICGFSALTKKPVMIGEFHFGALDRGLDATGIKGVKDQTERGKAYRYYMHQAAAHPMCLGAHYFTLNDQAYLGRFDGENYQIGIVDVTQKPYEEFEAAVIKTNCEIYDIINGEMKPTDERAEEIPPVFF